MGHDQYAGSRVRRGQPGEGGDHPVGEGLHGLAAGRLDHRAASPAVQLTGKAGFDLPRGQPGPLTAVPFPQTTDGDRRW